MTRRPSDSELLSRFTAVSLAEGAEQEAIQLMGDHGVRLADLVGKSQSELVAFLQMPVADRKARLRRLLGEARQHRSAERQRQSANLALAAASHLAGLARWNEDRVELDERIVLGSLLSDTARKYVRFDAEGIPPVCVRRAKLRDASRVLRGFRGLSCLLDDRGLRFRWRDGKGGLVLVDQVPGSEERQSVLPVAIVRPRPQEVTPHIALEQPRRPAIWADAFAGVLGAF